MAYHGLPAELSTLKGVTMLPNGANKFGQDMLPYWIKQIKPNILFTLMDIWMDGWVLDKNLNGIHWIKYIPLDSPTMLESWRTAIKNYEVPVAMSEFGKNLVKSTCDRDIEFIPHCVDTDLYKPQSKEKRAELRRRNNLKDMFVVGMVGRNQIRKMQPYFFEAFAKFAEGKDNVRLLLHMDLEEVEQPPAQFGWNLKTIAERIGIKDKLMMTHSNMGYQFKYDFDDNKMGSIYNQMDVHYLCPNEGFGVPAIESMACGVPNIIPYYTTGFELTNKGEIGWCPECSNHWYNAAGAKWGIPAEDKLIRALEWAYDLWNRNELQPLKDKARAYVVNKYSTKVLYPKWRELFRKTLIKPLPLDYNRAILGV